MSGCLLCLHLDLGLKTGFEFKVEVVFVNRDPFDQPVLVDPAGTSDAMLHLLKEKASVILI